MELNSDIEKLKNTCINTIHSLYEKYQNNEYILSRIYTHINTNLSTTIENELKTYEERIERHNMLINEQTNFIQVFLNKNQYYYLPNCSSFYEYNGKKFSIIKEDVILHKLLSEISRERILMDWKHRTKLNIMKLIKERTLFKCIPETKTIQMVLNLLYPLIFSSKDEVKYFLTIYGDNILKKNNNLIFLVNSHTKKMVSEMDKYANYFIGYNNISYNFMTKYHENHEYINCRIINSNLNYNHDLFKQQLKNYGLDIICVAVHYSNRFENSDNYINLKSDNNLKNFTYYLKNNTQESIIDNFCNKYIEKSPAENNCSIQWKNLHFLWKQFLSNSSFPNIIYSNNLKNILKSKYQYNDDSDCFINITTKFLPLVSEFIKFWENTMIYLSKNDNENNKIMIYDFEIDEICHLFKYWKDSSISGNINEQDVVKILKHFFPNVELIDDKFVVNIKSSLFDKDVDILISLNQLKQEYKNKQNKLLNNKLVDQFDNITNEVNQLISFEEAYTFYNTYMNNELKNNNNYNFKFIVSKNYFEKYINNNLSEYVIYDNFITNEWYI